MTMAAKLALGTVQFGLDYGVSNTAGRTSAEMVGAILNEARTHGIDMLDTAALYGESEAVLGRQGLNGFNIVTKTPRFATAQIEAGQADVLLQTSQQSRKKLQQESLYGLLAHHVDDLLAPGGELLWSAMQSLKETGVVAHIGASVYEGQQIDALLKRFTPDLIQLPVNILDQRLVKTGHIEKLKARGVEVHARSAFLQGLLLMSPEKVSAYFDPVRPLLRRCREAAAEQEMTPVQATLAYVRDLPGIDRVVVGVTSRDELRQCVEDFAHAGNFSGAGLACDESAFVNPALWRLT